MAAPNEDNPLNGIAIGVLILMALSVLASFIIRSRGPSGPDDSCDPVPTKATVGPAANGWFKVVAYGYSVEMPGPNAPRLDTPNDMQTLIGSLTVSDCKAAPRRPAATKTFRNDLKRAVKDDGAEKLIDLKDIVRQGHPGISYHIRFDPEPASKGVGAVPAVDHYGIQVVSHHRIYNASCDISGPVTKTACDRYLASLAMV